MWINYSCKCQDLETFVAPIVDNKGAPLVAIVNTTNISSHIVRSIEMPLREIINSTIECRINEKLKEDIVSSKVLGNVNNKFDALQQKMDEYIGDNGNQLTEVNREIATLRKDMEKLKNLAKTVNDMNSRVALSACAVGHTIRPRSTIKFSSIKTIEGITNRHLTTFKSSGVFVCEVPGLYHISVVLMSTTNNVHFKIFKNNIELMNGYINNYYTEHGNYHQSNAAIVVTELQKGDNIDIKPNNKNMNVFGFNYSCLTIVKMK
ncbi:COL8A [Mytilus coruscus]|uniref:COL8A n=1 Tax=Mytilus coruscus TaxID=42192 RepID=A0A6J8D0G6_MYTCO|nr:COL8A [Mytilus coruscus]